MKNEERIRNPIVRKQAKMKELKQIDKAIQKNIVDKPLPVFRIDQISKLINEVQLSRKTPPNASPVKKKDTTRFTSKVHPTSSIMSPNGISFSKDNRQSSQPSLSER